jgi:hypothetical protein
MPDTSVAPQGGDPYDPRMEARVSRLEEHMGDVKSAIASLDARVARVEIAVTRIEAMLAATLPHLATKAEVAELRTEMVAGFADKPGKTYMWGILAVLLTAYACGLAGLAIVK